MGEGDAAARHLHRRESLVSVGKALINDKIHGELGEDGLRDLLACLWPVDCQSCGRFLGDVPPALCVDDSIIFAVASLHHPGCRAPEWNDSGMIATISGLDSLSYTTAALVFPLVRDGQVEPWPMIVINPGLESVVLDPAEDRTWRVRPNLAFSAAGLAPSGAGQTIPGPVGGAVAFVTDASIAVAFQVAPLSTYEAPADDVIVAGARACGGFLVGVTHALNPAELTEQDLHTAMAAGQVLIGWAGLHGTVPAAPREPAALDATCVLHWNDHHLSVGTLLGRAPKILSSKKARAWATRLIGAESGALLPWEPAGKGRPEDGWFTLNALSVEQYFLRRYSDGWKLVKAFAQVAGTGPESDNEAKAWAIGVLQHRTGISAVTWEPGPTTPGSSTLYARA